MHGVYIPVSEERGRDLKVTWHVSCIYAFEDLAWSVSDGGDGRVAKRLHERMMLAHVIERMTFEGHHDSSCHMSLHAHVRCSISCFERYLDSITSPFQTWILKRHQQKKNMTHNRSP